MRRLCALCVCLCVLGVSEASAQIWRPDDRILITSFLNARGLATDHQHVWVATDNGLEVYDVAFKRWLAPSTIEDGYPVREGPGRIAYDSRLRVLWLVTQAQTLYAWSPVMQTWERRFNTDLPPELRAHLLRAPNERDPAWQVLQNIVRRDATGRQWQISDLIAADRSGTYWAAIYGNNFAFADTRNLSTQPYTFGTLSRGVSAIGIDAGDLYFGGDGTAMRTGVTKADTTLQRWTQFEARVSVGPQQRVRALTSSAHG